jgi:hypothetical protein
MSCSQKWQDVFISKTDYETDDRFVCAVQTVELDKDVPGVATIVAYPTDVIMPLLPEETPASIYNQVKVGSVIRVGGNPHHLTTPYLTVVEVIEVSTIYNGIKGIPSIINSDAKLNLPVKRIDFNTNLNISISTLDDPPNPVNADFKRTPQRTTGEGDVNGGGAAVNNYNLSFTSVAFRVNASFNCTVLPITLTNSGGVDGLLTAGYRELQTSVTNQYTQTRDELMFEQVQNLEKRFDIHRGHGNPSNQTSQEIFYYPMYLVDSYDSKQNELSVRLDNRLQAIHCIKLVAYQLCNKRHHGMHHAHEVANDDYFILHIDGVQGDVVSNNMYADGAFAVLCADISSESKSANGTVDLFQHDLVGLASQHFSPGKTSLRHLHIRVTDRQGKPAHIGRLHLWFKLHVSHS